VEYLHTYQHFHLRTILSGGLLIFSLRTLVAQALKVLMLSDVVVNVDISVHLSDFQFQAEWKRSRADLSQAEILQLGLDSSLLIM